MLMHHIVNIYNKSVIIFRNTESVKCINKRLLLADDEMDSDNEDSEDNSDLSFDDSLESDLADNASGWWCNLL